MRLFYSWHLPDFTKVTEKLLTLAYSKGHSMVARTVDARTPEITTLL